MRFWTSDTHFGHLRINELAGRPFSSADEMNEALISRWNAVVGKNDLVVHLGDVAMGEIAKSLPLMARLNGQKILVAGNHDRVFSGNSENYIRRFFPEYSKYFGAIFNGSQLVTLDDGTIVKVCHFPYSGDSTTDERYPEHRPVDEGHVLLHGHVHQMWKVKDRMLNVGVDVNNFAPVSEDDIIERIGFWA